jgi:translocation and assembly module TamB
MLGLAVLGVLSAAGVAISAAAILLETDLGRSWVIPRLLRLADDELAGSIELESFRLLPRGGLELIGARVLDPDGDVVLAVRRLTVHVDASRLRSRAIGFRVDLEGPTVLLARQEDGSLSLADAFRPVHPAPRRERAPPTWTFRVTRLALRDGSVHYLDAASRTLFHAEGVSAEARGAYGPRGARVELALRGSMAEPERAPVSLEAVGVMRGDELRVRTLRAAAGGTAVDLVALADVRSWRGRAAVLALAVEAEPVRRLVPAAAPLAADLTGALYVESDGARASAALDLRPREAAGSAAAAVAVRLPPGELAAGAELRLAGLDLAKAVRGAPPTALDLSAAARAAGADLASARGALSLSLAPSRLRKGQLGPAELRATLDRGLVEVSRLDAALPGATLRGSGRWRRGGELAARAAADARDLAALRRNLELLGVAAPPMSGSAAVEVEVTGTERMPVVALRGSSPDVRVGGVAARGLALGGELSGPLSAPRVRLDGTAGALAAGGLDARSVRLAGRVEGRAGELDLTGEIPGIGPDALALHAAGAASADGRVLDVSALALAWPGARFELQQPARVHLRGPSVDRLLLASGGQRLEVSGGIEGEGRRRRLQLRATLEAVDLARLPRALVPERLAVAGRLAADLTASGPVAAPQVSGRVALSDGKVRELEGLSLAGEVAYDGARRRVRLDVAGRRAAGGDLQVRGDVPLTLARSRADVPLALRVQAGAWPLQETLQAARVALAAPLDGIVAVDVQVGGTVGAPELRASAGLTRARYDELEPLTLGLDLETSPRTVTLRGRLDHRGARALDLDATVALRPADLLRDPRGSGPRLADAPLTATATIPGLDLAALAGREGLAADLAGRVEARLEVAGTARSPRGTAVVSLADGAYAGYAGLGARVTVTARDGSTAVEATTAMGQQPLARGEGALALPVERLLRAAEREAAALAVRVEVPGADLRQVGAGSPVPLAGQVTGRLSARGTLARPELDLDVAGRDLRVSGRALGDLTATAHGAPGAVGAEVQLAVTAGGTLNARLDSEGSLAFGRAGREALLRAPARGRLVADRLDLGFLPAVAPSLVRSASGKVTADVTAAGPLARMSPRGSVTLEGGAMALAELGEWSDIDVQAALTDDVLRVEKVSARRGDGTLSFTAEARGLARRSAPADVTAELRLRALTIPRAGQDLATFDLDARVTGTASPDALDLEVAVPTGTVRLPNRLPRKIQSLEPREDIVIGTPRGKEPPGLAAAALRDYRARAHVVAPSRFFVRSDNPRMNVELRADVTAVYANGLSLEGEVETVRGQIEPIGGRIFDLKRGRARFTGAGYQEAVLEVQALYEHPAAKVTVAVSGTVEHPEVKLSSEPPMDESQIALLIATGQTSLKAGSGGVGTLSSEEAGTAALGVVATQVFKDVIADKLPVDSVSLDSSQLRAGKYVTDKIYVGYTRRFNAKIEQGENTNEVRVEYQISPRWTFESRYGDNQSGGASLIWSLDY